MPTRLLRLLLAFAPILVLTLSTPARAQGNFFAGVGAGPYVLLDCCSVHARIPAEIGVHFSRNDTGFFLALEAVPTVGDDFLMFYGALRLGGDIQVWGNRELAVLVRPSGIAGVGFLDFRGPNNTFPYFVFQPAFDVRFSMARRLLTFWVRPVAFDFLVYFERHWRARDIDAGYQFLAGLDFNFG